MVLTVSNDELLKKKELRLNRASAKKRTKKEVRDVRSAAMLYLIARRRNWLLGGRTVEEL
jgi:hypothetical protein